MSFTITGGPNDLVAMNARALILVSNNVQQSTASFIVPATAGTTFAAEYRSSVGTATCNYANRSIWAIPLP